jgi:hypothetical protein
MVCVIFLSCEWIVKDHPLLWILISKSRVTDFLLKYGFFILNIITNLENYI